MQGAAGGNHHRVHIIKVPVVIGADSNQIVMEAFFYRKAVLIFLYKTSVLIGSEFYNRRCNFIIVFVIYAGICPAIIRAQQ